MGKHVISDLWQMQSLPLEAKIRMTKYRIRQWVEYYGEDGVYVSFSGGKDSTVLLDLVRQMYSNVTAVFVDTGLEYQRVCQNFQQCSMAQTEEKFQAGYYRIWLSFHF